MRLPRDEANAVAECRKPIRRWWRDCGMGGALRAPPSDHLQECESAYIRRALTEYGGRIADTAALLGISRKNPWEKTRKLEMADG